MKEIEDAVKVGIKVCQDKHLIIPILDKRSDRIIKEALRKCAEYALKDCNGNEYNKIWMLL